MAYIVTTKTDMVGLIRQAVAELHESFAEMAIVPVMLCETSEEVFGLLCEVAQFNPRLHSDILHPDAVGTITFGAVRTAHDALDAMESISIVDVAELIQAAKCAVKEYVPGKTRRLNLPMGEICVDIESFSRLTGLPLKSERQVEYSVFVKTGTAGDDTDRITLVCVKGKDSGQAPQTKNGLASLRGRLERRERGFDTAAQYFTRDYQTGWDVFADPQLDGILGLYRLGYSYQVRGDENRGGVEFFY